MKYKRPQKGDLDLYSANDDYSGRRDLEQTYETVDYHSGASIRFWYNQQDYGFASHWHTAIEIIMPERENYEVIVNDIPYILKPGEILFIPPRESHELNEPKNNGSRFIFLIDLAPIASIKGFANIEALLMQPLHITPKTHPKIHDQISSMLMAMREDYFNWDVHSELLIYAKLIEILVKISADQSKAEELFPNVRLYKQQEYMEKFSNVLEYIDAHFTEDLTLDGVAGATGFSKYHFSRLFKQYTSYTFCDYLCLRRLKMAEELLAQPDLSITEVALQSGFPSISTFNRLFKQQNKCTPTVYRTRNQTSI